MPRANRLLLVLDNPNIPTDVLMPRDEDVARMKQVINADSLLVAGRLVCAAAGHCALGALLFATGIPDIRLTNERGSPSEFSKVAAQRLYDWYRLDMDVASFIVNQNDYSDLLQLGPDGYVENTVYHGDEALDPNLVKYAPQLYAPTSEEIEARRTVIIDAIDFAAATQREFGVKSRWPQLGDAMFRAFWDERHSFRITTARMRMNEKLNLYTPKLPEPA